VATQKWVGYLAFGPGPVSREEEHMATGNFTYRSADDSNTNSFQNPQNNVCLFFEFPASYVDNNTNTTARVYAGQTCNSSSRDVSARKDLDVGADSLNSVQFVP
jgi:hypothetical protein